MSALDRLSVRDHWPLGIILLLALILRLWQINESLWLDELHTAWVVSGSLSDIPQRAAIGNQSPVYFVLPWLTTNLFGMSEWAIRLPSLVAGLALVAATYGFGFTVTRSIVGAATAALLATFDSNCLFYATEARPYACVQLVAVIQLVLFWKLQTEATSKHLAAFGLSTCLLFYLHYTAILLLLGECAVLALWLWLGTAFDRRSAGIAIRFSRRQLWAVALSGLIMLPGVMHLAEISSRRGNWTAFVNDTDPMLPVTWFALVSYVVVPAGLLASSRVVAKMTRREGETQGHVSSLLLICVWFTTPIAVTWLTTRTDVAALYFERYLIGIAVAPMLVAGFCIGRIGATRWRCVAGASVVAFAFYASPTAWHLNHTGRVLGDRNEDWMSAVIWLNDEYDHGPVFVRSGLIEADALRGETTETFKQYCLCPANSIYRFNKEAALVPLTTRGTGALAAKHIEVVRAKRAAWFVINAPLQSHEPIQRQVLTTLRSAGLDCEPPTSYAFGNVRVWRIDME